ncbi:hypothetical protein [Lutibacter sp.]|uniref:hypothetical protein n=1 Tax=Lutibacter sp. TaxID=1925666 RepID=UPI00356A1A42
MSSNNGKKNTVNTQQLPFYKELSQDFLTYSKQEALKNVKNYNDLFDLYLDTEIASDLELRRKMLHSKIQLNELASIIKSFKPTEIESESLILVGNE